MESLKPASPRGSSPSDSAEHLGSQALRQSKSLLAKVVLWTSVGGLAVGLMLLGPSMLIRKTEKAKLNTELTIRTASLLGPYVEESLREARIPFLPPPCDKMSYAVFDSAGEALVRCGDEPCCPATLDMSAGDEVPDHIHVRRALLASDGSNLGWLLVCRHPEPLFLALSNDLVGPFLFVVLFVLGNGILTIWVFYKLILTPISRLVMADRRGLRGDGSEAFIPEESIPEDELGFIMHSRNALLRRLEESQRFIQEKNRVLIAQRAELMRWSRELEERISHKKEELRRAHEQLVQNEKLASLGQLAAGIAHEINNPLATIAGYAEDLREQAASPSLVDNPDFTEFPSSLQVIEDQVFRCKKIVRKLLDFARKSHLHIEPTDVAGLILQTIPLVEHRRAEKDCKLVTNLNPVRSIRTCPDSLQQVLVNLLQNAIDAGEAGSVVSVGLSEHGDFLVISVSDQGDGIAKDIQNRIFDPFFTTKAVGAGTGLGLSICYGIISDLKGTLSFDTVQGQGTTFDIHIPDYGAEVLPEPIPAGPGDTTISYRPIHGPVSASASPAAEHRAGTGFAGEREANPGDSTEGKIPAAPPSAYRGCP